ncbi:hypothetical protein [Pseudalkalibacillus caeni]|uniref:Uncharacterized protein n=1 Tax=Exobacillus caeni TaxID=2574798 RepID=A0A5R9F7E1_9BACL|nr:hypothetical protein [Pseudalkalibacillus caeni]TLS38951.1 hypothetical protein FCL54_01165 [Pseudalkalibacillus caeni]
MEERLKDLRKRMTDTKAVQFTGVHKEMVRRKLNQTEYEDQGSRKIFSLSFSALLSYAVCFLLLIGAGYFSIEQAGIFNDKTTGSNEAYQEELYYKISTSPDYLDGKPGEILDSHVKQLAAVFMQDLKNWKIIDRNARYAGFKAVLIKGSYEYPGDPVTEFASWIHPATGIPIHTELYNKDGDMINELNTESDWIKEAIRSGKKTSKKDDLSTLEHRLAYNR